MTDLPPPDVGASPPGVEARAAGPQPRHRHLAVRLLGRMLALVMGVAVPLLVMELVFRIFGPFFPGYYDVGPFVRRHPILGHIHPPGHTMWVRMPNSTARLDINPMGLRDPRQTYEKPPGTFRILALGDSYIEAAQVEAEDSITVRLEQQLTDTLDRPVEVINSGVFGYGTAQEYLMLDQIGAKFEPDLVVLFYCHCNDILNNNYRLELIDGDLSRALKPYYDLPDDDAELRLILPPKPNPRTSLRYRLRDTSFLYNVIETGVIFKLELPDPREEIGGVDGLVEPTKGKYNYEPTGEWERSWRITARLIEMIQARSQQIGAPLVIVGLPEWRMLEPAYWERPGNRRLLDSGRGGPDAQVRLLDAITTRLHIPHVELGPAFEPRVLQDGLFRYFIEGDYHWTPDGHAVATAAVADFLLNQEGLLPR
ncbi:MAG: hypothetical protein AB7P40_05120 [Chloroflexota bacterium]